MDGNFSERTVAVERNSNSYLLLKRGLDIVISLVGIIILSPVFLMTALLIVIDDGFPVIYRQQRNGLFGEVFWIYKFRSMCRDAEKKHKELLKSNELDGPAFKMKDDPRITKIGKFIRKTSIDELPQLVNVLKGEMSLVGPRPLPTYETEQCNFCQNQRLNVKPGITCYWQCSGRSDISFDEWIEMDLKYIREMSLLTDIKIILKTFGAVFGKNGAY